MTKQIIVAFGGERFCFRLNVFLSRNEGFIGLPLVRHDLGNEGTLDSCRELVDEPLLKFFEAQGIKPSRITPGKPWKNGRNEGLNGTFCRECLNAEQFHSLREARVVIEDWRRRYNYERPHGALGYQVPVTVFVGAMKGKP